MAVQRQTKETQRRPIRREMLVDELYELLKEQIMDLAVAPGARLNIDQLAREFGVSATPLREALARLEAEGLLERRALQGYRAVPLLNRRKLTELMDVRLLLEPSCASAAAAVISRDSLAVLQRSVETTKVLARNVSRDPTYRTYRDFAAQDALFHDTIAGEAGNELLRNLLFGLHTHLHLYRLHFGREIAPPAADEHVLIVKALRAHDSDLAASAMSLHIKQALERLLPMTEESGEAS